MRTFPLPCFATTRRGSTTRGLTFPVAEIAKAANALRSLIKKFARIFVQQDFNGPWPGFLLRDRWMYAFNQTKFRPEISLMHLYAAVENFKAQRVVAQDETWKSNERSLRRNLTIRYSVFDVSFFRFFFQILYIFLQRWIPRSLVIKGTQSKYSSLFRLNEQQVFRKFAAR